MARRRDWAGAAAITIGGALLAALVHPLVGLAAAAVALATPYILADIDLAFLVVVAVIGLLPFAAVPLGVGFNPTLLDGALAVLYAIWAVRLATRTDSLRPLPPLAAGVIAFMGLAVAAFLAGFNQDTPTKNQIRVFAELLGGAGLYFVVWTLVRDRASLRKVYLALVGVGTVAAVVGLALYALPDHVQMSLLSRLSVVGYPSGPGVLRYLNDDPARLQRATGTSIDPNSFGGILAVVAALLVPQVASRTPVVQRRNALVAAVLVVGALLVTVSRGSLLGFAAALAVVGLARDRRLLIGGGLALAGFLAASRLLPWTAGYVAHFTAGLTGEDLATRMRFGEYKDALRLIGRYPVLGVGFGGVRDIDLYRGVSSLYLSMAQAMGLVGLTAFVALMLAFCARLLAGWRRLAAGGTRAILLGTLAALVAALVSGLFDHYFFTYPHAFALLWLVLGVGVCAARVDSRELTGA